MKKQGILKQLSMLLAGALLAGSLAGCGQAAPAAPAASPASAAEAQSTAAEAAGGHVDLLRIGTTYQATGYSVMDTNSAFGRMLYNSFANLNFWAFDENGKISTEGCFFRDWQVSEDNTVLTAQFDTTGLNWHDGQPVTAEDVEFTFGYYQKQNYPWFLRIASVEIPQEGTLQVTFAQPCAFAFVNSTNLMYGILPKHIWEKVEDPKTYDSEDAAIGCGPFRLTERDADAQISYYEAVPDYPLGEVTVDKVELHSYDTQSALLTALQNDEIDVMYGYSSSLDTTLLPLVDADPNLDRGESLNTATHQIMFGFNQTPTDDLAFRMGVRYALDYDLLSSSLTGDTGEAANEGAVSPACLGYDGSLPKNTRDLEKSAKALDEGGYLDTDGDGYRELPDGSPMEVKIQLQSASDINKRIAEMLQINLGEAGIRTTIDQETISNSDYATQLRMDGTYEIYISMTTVGMASWAGIANYLADVTITSGQHFGTYGDETYLAAYNAMMESANYEEYTAAFGDIQRMNAEACPGIALAVMKTFYPYRTDRITGWTNYPAWGVINAKTWYNAHAQ